MESSQDFEQAYESYADKIYRFLYWQTRDQALAEDLTGEAFSRAWRGRESFRDGSVQAWLFSIARRVATPGPPRCWMSGCVKPSSRRRLRTSSLSLSHDMMLFILPH